MFYCLIREVTDSDVKFRKAGAPVVLLFCEIQGMIAKYLINELKISPTKKMVQEILFFMEILDMEIVDMKILDLNNEKEIDIEGS